MLWPLYPQGKGSWHPFDSRFGRMVTKATERNYITMSGRGTRNGQIKGAIVLNFYIH